MSTLEGIIGLVASVFAILGGLYIAMRWLGKRIDKWVDALVENSSVMRGLSGTVVSLSMRVRRLEDAINHEGKP
jgi:hypothetical protein